jgi:ribulose-5-phosphate 4-epimerase/fuculose-1-phosphate aldolase
VSENPVTAFSSVFLDKNPPVDAQNDALIQWCKKIAGTNAVTGNISFRTKMGFIITGSETPLANMTKDKATEVRGVVFGLNRPSIYVKGAAAPAEETLMHSVIYESFPETNAIFFITSPDILAAMEKTGTPAVDAAQSGRSQAFAQEVVNLMKINNNSPALILKNYGVIICGETIAEAGSKAEELLQNITGSKAKTGKK